jgi:hypothetical protein
MSDYIDDNQLFFDNLKEKVEAVNDIDLDRAKTQNENARMHHKQGIAQMAHNKKVIVLYSIHIVFESAILAAIAYGVFVL